MSVKTPLQNLYSSLLTSVRSIPADPLRPNLQLSGTLETLVHRAFGVQSSKSIAGATPVDPSTVNLGLKEDSVSDKQRKILEDALVALRTLKSDDAMKKYPISAKTLQPPTDPFYYTRIIQGVQRAAQGKKRAWWKTFMQVKGEA